MPKDKKTKKLRWNFWDSSLFPLFVLLIGLIIAFFVTQSVYRYQNQILHVKSMAEAETRGRWFAEALEKRVALSETLSALIYENDGKYEDSEDTTEKIFSIHKDEISSVQYAPDGKVSYIYPLQGNEEGFLDLFQEEDRREEAEYARDNRIAVVAGPFQLKQGGLAFAIRNPVYLMDEKGEEKFWGFAIVLADCDEIIKETGIHTLSNEGYEYRLTKKDIRDGKLWTVSESGDQDLENAESYVFSLPGYDMSMSVKPKNGWVPWYLILPVLVGLSLISVLMSIMIILYQKTKAQNEMLQNQSETDALTGFLNRRGGDRKMTEYISDNRDANGILLAIDIDNFKRLNDLYGHAAEDRALVVLSRKLKTYFREDGIYIRNGGDEFLIFLMDREVKEMKSRIQDLASEKFSYYFEKKQIQFSISIGYASYPDQALNFSELCQEADAALYFVKMNGKKSAAGFENTMNKENRVQLGFNLMDIATGIPGALLIYRARTENEEILFANNGLIELFECDSMKEFMTYVSSSFRNVVHPEDRERVNESIWEQINNPDNEHIDKVNYRIITKSGKVKTVRDIGRLVHSPYYGELFYVFLYPDDLNKTSDKGEI